MNLRLVSVSLHRVELYADLGDASRHVSVTVGRGGDWYDACQFPNIDSESGRSLGDEALDHEVLARAAEELIRLAAAVEAAKGRMAA